MMVKDLIDVQIDDFKKRAKCFGFTFSQ